MALEKIEQNDSGQEAADKIYNNDAQAVLKTEFTEALATEITKPEGTPAEIMKGKTNGTGITGGDVTNDTTFRLTLPDATVTEDSLITEMRVYLTAGGPIQFAIGTASAVTGFKVRKLIPVYGGAAGLNVFAVDEFIKAGESVACSPVAGSTATINYTFGEEGGVTGTSKFIQMTSTAQAADVVGYYAYSFKTKTTGGNILKATFAQKDETVLKDEFTQALQDEITRDADLNEVTVGPTQNGITGDDVVGGDGNYRYNTIGVAGAYGILQTARIIFGSVGTFALAIGTPTPTGFIVRKQLEPLAASQVGANTFILNEQINAGEALALGVTAGSARVRFQYVGTTGAEFVGNRFAQQSATAAPTVGGIDGYYCISFIVGEGDFKPLDVFFNQDNANKNFYQYLATEQIGRTAVTRGAGFPANDSLAGLTTNQYITPVGNAPFQAKIKLIRIQMVAAGNVVFSVGLIDQFGYWIEERTFSKAVAVGVNTFVVDELIGAGQQLAIKTPSPTININNAGGSYYRSNGNGYGQLLQVVNGANLSFEYDLYEYAEHAIVGRAEFNTVAETVNALKVKPATIYSTPSRKKFTITCDDDGTNLRTAPAYPENVMVLGNSITKHPITSFWWGEWGMAASVAEKDFVHVLENMVQAQNPTTVFDCTNIAAWEQNYNGYDKTQLNPFLAGKDMVIVRLGENVVYGADYQAAIESLFDYIRAYNPDVTLITTGQFWRNDPKEAAMVAAAAVKNVPFIQLDQLDNAGNKSVMGAIVYDAEGNPHAIDNQGVANHPSDTGMQNIAEAIYNAIF